MEKTFLYISKSNQPFYNLALEDYLLKNWDTSASNLILLYVNTPSVIIGRNQNLFEEVNVNYCEVNKIEVARRISGGGTVFHDEGNLNWSVFSKFDTKKVNNYSWSAKYVMNLLNSFGLKPYLTPRNAIEIGGLKLSGQAQFTNRKSILSHGTLLVNSDLNYLQKAIEIDHPNSIESKASKSVRSTTKNLSYFLNRTMNMEDILTQFSKVNSLDILNEIKEEVDLIKFQSEGWLFQRSPVFKVKHIINGEEVTFKVRKALIEEIYNKKGHPIKDSHFINKRYLEFILHH